LKAYQFSWSVFCCAEWFLYTIRLGQRLGSCNVSVSVSSRTKCPTSRSRLGHLRLGSRLGLGLKGLVHIPAGIT